MDAEQSESLAAAIDGVARALSRLGNGDAATAMGAIENLALEVREGSTRIAEALNAIAEAIEDHK